MVSTLAEGCYKGEGSGERGGEVECVQERLYGSQNLFYYLTLYRKVFFSHQDKTTASLLLFPLPFLHHCSHTRDFPEKMEIRRIRIKPRYFSTSHWSPLQSVSCLPLSNFTLLDDHFLLPPTQSLCCSHLAFQTVAASTFIRVFALNAYLELSSPQLVPWTLDSAGCSCCSGPNSNVTSQGAHLT